MLGTLEQHVLLAVLRGAGSAYGVSIADELEKRTGKRHSLGAIYTTLDRLTAKKYVSTHAGEATAERGGRAKQYFRLTLLGESVLTGSLNAVDSLSRGLRVRNATKSA